MRHSATVSIIVPLWPDSGSDVALRYWLSIIGLLISVALVAIVLSRLNWDVFWMTLRGVTATSLVMAGLALVGSLTIRATRWRLITVCGNGQRLNFQRATWIGYFANTILPLRAGEFMRILAINRLTGVPVAQALTGAVVDRVSDVLMLGVSLIAVIVIHSRLLDNVSVNSTIIGATVLAGLAFFGFVGWRRLGKSVLARWVAWLPNRFQEKLPRWHDQSGLVVSRLREPGRVAVIAALTLLAVVTDYTAIWLVMQSFDWRMSLMAAVTVGVFLNTGMLLPAAPGYLGIYQVACVFALGLYGVTEAEAVAYSVVLQLLVISLLLVIGAGVILSCSFWLTPGEARRQILVAAKAPEANGS